MRDYIEAALGAVTIFGLLYFFILVTPGL